MNFDDTFNYKLIYIFRINDKQHRGYLKIGEATIHAIENPMALASSCPELNAAAEKRIASYTRTAGITYELLHTEIALYKHNGHLVSFRDYQVHQLLRNSGIVRHQFDTKHKQNEWFKLDLATAQAAITALKEGRKSLNNSELSQNQSPIIFRPEQKDAIERTIRQFKTSRRMLWNAKMRFGKTLSALEVARRMQFRKTIILTHRPVVSDSWFEDFHKIFYADDNFAFGSKSNGSSLVDLEQSGKSYVFFASIQDLRGSSIIGGKFDKNHDILNTRWNFVIIDEAHEGTKTELGEKVKNFLNQNEAKCLELSGTPFNLLHEYNEKEIYTWDYVMEQRAKQTWDSLHCGDSNPYEGLPRLSIFTYQLNTRFSKYVDFEDKAFNFREFFRTWTGDILKDKNQVPQDAKIGDFIHGQDVLGFLNLISQRDDASNYPFSTEQYREYFRHSLWMVPGVKEAKALSALLKTHPIFSQFTIANVAGEGDEDDEQANSNALKLVKDAIGENPDEHYSITLSCGRLTTGVSVKPWTAVFMLAGSYSTAAASYMQTIFRVQTPATINGRMKEQCYVFDFAPDRTLKIIAETSKISAKAGQTSQSNRSIIGEFLNFCPIIAVNGTSMVPYDVDKMLQQLKQIYTEQVVRNGFDDINIYNDKLLQLNEIELNAFNELKKIVGSSKQTQKQQDIDINTQGFTEEEYEKHKEARKKPPQQRTPEEQDLIEIAKRQKKQKETAISILRAISIRIPLLIYGADLADGEDITLGNFTQKIDDASWLEFMPDKVSKAKFNEFAQYYDPDIFIAAGRKIRQQVNNADLLAPTERVQRIADIFATFKNPDKETVLTPWRVVNLHLGDCLGGYVFYDESYHASCSEPRYIQHAEVTEQTLSNSSARILEINSKTGLYPLYVTYSIFRQRCKEYPSKLFNEKTERELWLKTVAENIYVICKTPMAKQITKRTLLGQQDSHVNMCAFSNLLQLIQENPEKFIKKARNASSYNKSNKTKHMKFDAVVGNPPYQKEGRSTRKAPIYHLFYDAAFRLSDKVSLITPARFLFKAGQTPKAWVDRILEDIHFKVIRFFPKSTEIFSSVDIKGGVVITYRDTMKNFGAINTFTEFEELKSILTKIYASKQFQKGEFCNLVSAQGIYRFTNLLFDDFPEAATVQGQGTGVKITSNSLEKLPEVFLDMPPSGESGYIQMVGRCENRRVYRWIVANYVEAYVSLNSYKVLVPEANGSGAIGEVLSTPIIGTPMMGHTDTFLSIGSFDTEGEAENCKQYIRSKFTRTLLGTLKATQHNPKNTWANVPLQDFSNNSDIDWTQTIDAIDAQLYKKYALSEEEIKFIESMIKPMP